MKKILYSVMAMAALTFSFTSLTSCEDVPAPYEIPGEDGNEPGQPETPAVEPAGTGSLADPFNVAAAIQYIENGGSETTDVYVKGKVVSVQAGSFDANYGSLKYYISDDGTETNQFLVYNGYAGPNRTKFSGEDALKQGDEVVICGKLVNYNGTKEFTTNNYIVSLNGNGGTDQPSTGVATGDGTQANPFNSVAANKYTSSLEADKESDKDVYVKGKVVSVTQKYGATDFGTATFYISDDGKADNQFLVYRALYLNNAKYTSGTDINVGDDVVVCGKVINFKGNTPETVTGKAYLVSLKSNGGGNDNTDGEVSGNAIKLDPSALSLANATSVGTQTLSDGTQLIFDQGTNSKNDPKYYDAGKNIRMYPGNTVTIKSSKKILSVVFDCDTYNNILCNAEGNVTATAGKVVVSGSKLNVNDINGLETLITNASTIVGTASQIRIKSIIIYYAD